MEGIVEWILKEGGTKCQEMEHLLYQSGAEIPITEGLLKEAAENNNGCYGYEAMKLLFQHQRNALSISEVVKTAARNTGDYGYKTMELLSQHHGDVPQFYQI